MVTRRTVSKRELIQTKSREREVLCGPFAERSALPIRTSDPLIANNFRVEALRDTVHAELD